LGFVAVVGHFTVQQAHAQAILQTAYVTLSDPRTGQTGVTQNFWFKAAQATLGSVIFQYCAYPSEVGAACTPSGASGAGTGALGSYYKATSTVPDNAFTGSWDAANTQWKVTSLYATESTSAGSPWRFQFTGMTNPSIAACVHATPANYSTGTCYVRIKAYPSTNYSGTPDTAIVSITVTQAVTVDARVDPVFTFTVTGVAGSGDTRNGTALSAITTTVTTVPFGSMTANQPKYAAHQLTVTTNTTAGYTISTQVTGNMTGTSYSKDIDPFIGVGANQTTAQSWTHPTGTVSGSDTGWLGVASDDTGITSPATNKFFSLNTTEFIVAKTVNSATARVTNVVYGIEVNAYQTADNYTTTLLYNALPTY